MFPVFLRRIGEECPPSACSTGLSDSAILADVSYEPLLHVVLHQPEIPQNTGNIGRTCVAVGAKLWLVRPLGFRMDDRYLSRSGLDYWQHLPWATVDDWNALTDELTPESTRTWYFTKTATRLYTDAHFQAGDVLVFGSETAGLPRSLLDTAGDQALKLPMRPEVRSINLASCVAAVGYEALRQINTTRQND